MKEKFHAVIFQKKETAESYFRTCKRPNGFAQIRYIPAHDAGGYNRSEKWVVIH